MRNFKEFIQETHTITIIKDKQITIKLSKIDLEGTEHSKERLTRSDNVGSAISEKEIVKAVEMVLPQIVTDLAQGEIGGKDTVWISNSKTGLNIIMALNFKRGTDSVVVITVMRKKGFKSRNKLYKV